MLINHLAEDAFAGNCSKGAAVAAVVAVVAHDKIFILTDDEKFTFIFLVGVGWRLVPQIGLLQQLAVHINCAVIEVNGFTRQGNDAFDDQTAILGIFRGDDVGSLWQML